MLVGPQNTWTGAAVLCMAAASSLLSTRAISPGIRWKKDLPTDERKACTVSMCVRVRVCVYVCVCECVCVRV